MNTKIIYILGLLFILNSVLFGKEIKIIASDGYWDDRFGEAVAISGDYVIVGVPSDDQGRGAAYIFHRNDTTWYEETKLLDYEGLGSDHFGISVDIDGEYAIIGAYGGKGAAYIFKRNGITWNQESKLQPIGGDRTINFGIAVSISGNYVIIGARNDSTRTGSTYIFERDLSMWTQVVKLTTNQTSEDAYGNSVDISGDYAIVGDYGDAENGWAAGAAYIYHRSGTSWYEESKLLASDGGYNNQFGYAVSISGDYAIISTWAFTNDSKAYIFKRNEDSWNEQIKMHSSDLSNPSNFGTAVSIYGNYAIVGAPYNKGSVYAFRRSGDSWNLTKVQEASDGKSDDHFGSSVGISEKYAIIGALNHSSKWGNDGAAYIYHVTDDLLLTSATDTNRIIKIPVDYSTIQFGIDEAVDGDTIIVAAGMYPENINFKGKSITVGSWFIITKDTSYISNTIIDGNQHDSVIKFVSGEDTTSKLIGFTIQNGNSSEGEGGGGIICQNSSNPVLEYLRIQNNYSSNDGGGILCSGSNPIIRNLTVENNEAGDDGGGIACELTSAPIIENVKILNNKTGQHGGGIHSGGSSNFNSSPLIKNSIIRGNSARWGGGLYGDMAKFKLLKSLIVDNASSDYGGGICCFSGTPEIINTTIVNNTTQGVGGGIICTSGSGPKIVNCILANNNGNSGIWTDSQSIPIITHCDVWNNEQENFHNCGENIGKNVKTNVNGDSCDLYFNIQFNPSFVDSENENYHLQQISSCIDAGDPSSPLDPDGTRADMGAYYFHKGDGIAPDAPQNLQSIPGDNKVTLSWTSNIEPDLAYYKIYRSQSQGFIPTSNDSLAIVVEPDTVYVDTNVINFKTYYYRISAVDISGNESGFSDEVNAYPYHVLSDPDIILSNSSYNFNQVILNETKSLETTIRNAGERQLQIAHIENSLSVFTSNPTSGVVDQNDSLIVTLSFTPIQERVYQDTFKISCNDPDESIVELIVQGQGVTSPKPSIKLSSHSHDFGSVSVFTTSSWQLIIQNNGNADLAVQNISSNNPTYTVSSTQFLISPSNQKQIEVRFNPDSVKYEAGIMTIHTNDPAHPELDINLSGRGVDNQSPEVNILGPTQSIWINSEFKVSAQVNDNWKLSIVQLNYRKGTENNYHNKTMTAIGNNLYDALIPASSISFVGLAYFIKAVDESGNTATSDTLSHNIYFSDDALTTNMNHSPYSTGYPRGQWHMFSVPCILNKLYANSVLNDENELGSYGEPNWRLFSYEDTNSDGIKDGYQEYDSNIQSSIFQFSSCKAFWLKANPKGEKIEIDAGAGYVLPLAPYRITLKPGWNQVGNPFAFPIIYTSQELNIIDRLYSPDGTGGYQFINMMNPWCGYFIYVNGMQPTDLTFYPNFSQSVNKKIDNDFDWLVQINASCGYSKDDINFFGISKSSSDHWDKCDYPEPPVIGEFISLSFPHVNWEEQCEHFTADIRNGINGGQIWDVEVLTNQSSASVTLYFETLKKSVSEIECILYDICRNKTFDITDFYEYTYYRLVQEEKSIFQIIAGDQNFISQKIHEIEMNRPQKYSLSQNYPNPFNTTTCIQFELPLSSDIKLSLFNMLGEEVHVLAEGFYPTGLYNIYLDSIDLTSGLYFYKLDTGRSSIIKKLVVLR